MTPRDFCYWLQGHFEISDPTTMTAKELLIIKNHLNLVFTHSIDTQYDGKDRDKLQNIHDGVHGSNRGNPEAKSRMVQPTKLEVMC